MLQELLKSMAKPMAAELPAVWRAAWSLCEAAAALFQDAVVTDDNDTATVGAEGVGLEALVEQIYEFFLTLLGLKKDVAEGLMQVLERLVYHTIGFMQVRTPPPRTHLRSIVQVHPRRVIARDAAQFTGALDYRSCS